MLFKFEKDYYGDYRELFRNAELHIKDNDINCLVGCNGSGKSTALRVIEDFYLKKEGRNIRENPFSEIFRDGSANKKPKYYYFKFNKDEEGILKELDYEAHMMARVGKNCTSLGENIEDRIGRTAYLIGSWARNHPNTKLILLWDDCDAGTSLDRILSIKKFFNYLIKKTKERDKIDVTIILTANSYELCRDSHCIDVSTFKTVKFNDYEDYKAFVLNSFKFKLRDMRTAAKKRKEEKEKKL